MTVDRYTKAVLTVIAGCLLWICAMGAGPSLDAQSVSVRRIPNSSIQPVVIVGTGTLDQEGTVTVTFVKDRDGRPHTDPTLPILLPYTAAKPLPVSLPYTPTNPLPSLVLNGDDAPLPIEITGLRKPGKWDPLNVRVEDANARPRPGGGER
jgi:hypothetical protein